MFFGLAHTPPIERNHLVGNRNRARTVRDQKDRALPTFLIERPQDRSFVQGIEIRSRLIEQDEGRIVQEGAGKPQPLPLAAREGISELADLRIEPLGQALDEIEDRCFAAGIFELGCGRIGPCYQQKWLSTSGIVRLPEL